MKKFMVAWLFLLFVIGCRPAGAGPLTFPGHLDWINTTRPLAAEDTQGRVVILDFWTYGCINCMHVLPDLAKLEHEFGSKLLIVSVHSPKFDNERNPQLVARIVDRYGIHHPVVNDVDYQLWNTYRVAAWPSFVIFDPQGQYVGKLSGEGQYASLRKATSALLAEYKGMGNQTKVPFKAMPADDRPLRYPGKIAVSPKWVAIADSGHNQVVITNHQGQVFHRIGSGNAAYQSGTFQQAAFHDPQGMAFIGSKLYVADTDNHAIRVIDLAQHTVKTVAGTGKLGSSYRTDGDPLQVALRSPWDLVADGQRLYIAMAGTHQLWQLDLQPHQLSVLAGNGREGLLDGRLRSSNFSQPSGLSLYQHQLYVADAEDSSVRRVDLTEQRVETLIGHGLFDFGDRDGAFSRALIQHPLGVQSDGGQVLYLADTYNHKVKKLDLAQQQITTVVDDLGEPGGLAWLDGTLLITDTNHGQIKQYDPSSGETRNWPLTPITKP